MQLYLASICHDFVLKFPMRAGPFAHHVPANGGGWQYRVFDRHCTAYDGQFPGWDITGQAWRSIWLGQAPHYDHIDCTSKRQADHLVACRQGWPAVAVQIWQYQAIYTSPWALHAFYGLFVHYLF
jgi:hypothetical protein